MAQFGQRAADGASEVDYRGSGVDPFARPSSNAPFSLGIALLVLALAAVGFGDYREYLVKSSIQQHGQRQDAAVLRIYEQVIRSNNPKFADDCYAVADYQITPLGRTEPLNLSMRLGRCDGNNSVVAYATQNKTLPIAYDVTNPSMTHLNFDDEVFREDTLGTLKRELVTLTTFAALGVAAVTALSLVRRA